MIQRAWVWLFHDSTGEHLSEPVSPAFTTRFDAELWLGANWRDLRAQGVAHAALQNNNELIGKPLDLLAPGAEQ